MMLTPYKTIRWGPELASAAKSVMSVLVTIGNIHSDRNYMPLSITFLIRTV